jgi:branched-chain amino acid aminotransferase
MDYIQANTEGRLHPASEPSISPLNRGFLYGDAIYEVWRTYDGTIFAFEEHWRRLEQSAMALQMELPLDRGRLLREIRRTATAFFERAGGRPELYIRLQITRGAGPIGLKISLADRPGYVILIQSLKDVPEKWRRNGLRLSVPAGMRRLHPETVNPAWKTGNYLNNILCLGEAQARGADEVLMTNLAGEVTEAAVSNVFFVRGKTVITPPLSAGILAGITRGLVLDTAERTGIPACEETIRLENLAAFQECFITSTTKEIVPVAAIDGTGYAVGEDTMTRKLQTAFQEHARSHVAAHPELKIPG